MVKGVDRGLPRVYQRQPIGMSQWEEMTVSVFLSMASFGVLEMSSAELGLLQWEANRNRGHQRLARNSSRRPKQRLRSFREVGGRPFFSRQEVSALPSVRKA